VQRMGEKEIERSGDRGGDGEGEDAGSQRTNELERSKIKDSQVDE
jgi:hypothetical protein